MSKNIVRVPLNGTKVQDFEPNVVKLAEILPKFGFRWLTDATPETLPVGSVVVIYDCQNQTMLSAVVVHDYTQLGFHVISFEDLNSENPEVLHFNQKYDFEGKLYKVIMNLPVEGTSLQPGVFPKAFECMDFKPLGKATPQDLPEGSLVLLCTKAGSVSPAVVRCLSMHNKRFLYWAQSPHVAGDWHPHVIMDELDSFGNYYYMVIS